MEQEIKAALNHFIKDANIILQNKIISAYCFGSAIYDDFHIGYSDLDFFIIVDNEISEDDFNQFHNLRTKYKDSLDPYTSILEGEIISLKAIKNDISSNTIYWGTSKDRLNDKYGLSGFSLRGLLTNGFLIFGNDLRDMIPFPNDEKMLEQVNSMISFIRKYAQETTEEIHSADWLFLISQSIYWLMAGQTTGKTASAKWILSNCNYSWNNYLKKAIELRENPELAQLGNNKKWLRALSSLIQTACDTLESELRAYNNKL